MMMAVLLAIAAGVGPARKEGGGSDEDGDRERSDAHGGEGHSFFGCGARGGAGGYWVGDDPTTEERGAVGRGKMRTGG